MTSELMAREYPSLRTPPRHGQCLQVPPLQNVAQLWDDNGRHLSETSLEIGGQALHPFRAEAQAELLQRAVKYTRQYRDVEGGVGGPLLMAGHQPELFHAGVWYKNFVLSSVAAHCSATAVNLIIDNDVCTAARLAVPSGTTAQPQLAWVQMDRSSAQLPFECRPIEDMQVFASFGQRVASCIGPLVDSPLIEQLWPLVTSAAEQGLSLGGAIAAGRHRLEADFGIHSLEIPLNQVCTSDWFFRFAMELLSRAQQFREIHNRALYEYRAEYRIRSRAHPVPELASDGPWCETPFWVWTTQQPQRRPLFVRARRDGLSLRDHDGWSSDVNLRDGRELAQLQTAGVSIRPRALVTTLYARMVLSQLFVHGTGGARYDQLTDLISERFFGFRPPDFLTATATMHLPIARDAVDEADLTRIDVALRQLDYHPELYLPPDAGAASLVAEKRRWVADASPKGQRGRRHRHLGEINRQMQPLVQSQRQALMAERRQLVELLRAQKILGSREFSFCLFPENLADQLRQMSAI